MDDYENRYDDLENPEYLEETLDIDEQIDAQEYLEYGEDDDWGEF